MIDTSKIAGLYWPITFVLNKFGFVQGGKTMKFRILAVFVALILCTSALSVVAAEDDGNKSTTEIAFSGKEKTNTETGLLQMANLSDQISYQAALGRILEKSRTGMLNTWKNPQSGQHGTITPTRTIVENGIPCREYKSTRVIGGRTQSFKGIACRVGKAQWPIRTEKKVATEA